MAGGIARDGWYGLGLGKKKLLREGNPAQGVLQRLTSLSDSGNVGNVQFDCTIQVHAPGGAPYVVQGLFRIPIRLVEGLNLPTALPVKVHPSKPDRVAIDWDAWEAARAPSA